MRKIELRAHVTCNKNKYEDEFIKVNKIGGIINCHDGNDKIYLSSKDFKLAVCNNIKALTLSTLHFVICHFYLVTICNAHKFRFAFNESQSCETNLFNNNIPCLNFHSLHAIQQNVELGVSKPFEKKMITHNSLNVCLKTIKRHMKIK